jgi:hypothetical protein
MFTSAPALMRVSPVAASIRPFTATDPTVEATVSAPALMGPVVISPRAPRAIGAVPASMTAPGATFMVPLVAVSETAPWLVTMASFTFRSRVAVIVTAPPSAPPRPSTGARQMSPPAVTARASAPETKFTIGR